MKTLKIFVLLFVFLVHTEPARPEIQDKLMDVGFLMQSSCFSFAVVGTCSIVGVMVLYWNPDFYVETVKTPFDTAIPIVGTALSLGKASLLQQVASKTKLLAPLLSGSDEDMNSSSIRVQGFDVHVVRIPFDPADIAEMFGWCFRDDALFEVNYLSELDFFNWRTGGVDLITQFPRIVMNPGCIASGFFFPNCLGFWGPMAPRVAFIHHYSDAVGSLVTAWRGAHISFLPESVGHVVTKHHLIPVSRATKWSMISPKISGCILTGENPVFWDINKISLSGRYGWLCWNPVVCCIL